MKPKTTILLGALIIGLFAGCTYFQPKDEPPPLPPIEETKPPLKMQGSYFKSFPWDALPKPLKDGNDPDTFMYTVKEGETLETVAEKNMGNPDLAAGLARYNGLSSAGDVHPGDIIVIPNPIFVVKSQIMVKKKGEKEFSGPEPFDTDLKKGDEYKLRFEPNIDGYLYVFLEQPKKTTMLFPPPPPKTRSTRRGRRRRTPPPEPKSAKVSAFKPVLIPVGKKGFKFDPRRAGDRVHVFLCIRKIPALEDLRDRKKIDVRDIQDVSQTIKIGDIYSDEPPYTLLRIEGPKEILGFPLNLKG
jgi:hypothetical protein